MTTPDTSSFDARAAAGSPPTAAPASAAIPAGACPICGPGERSLYVRHKAHSLYRCHGCGLVYLDPLPDDKLLADLYTDPYAGATEGFFRKVPAKTRRARIRVRALTRYLKDGPRGLRFLDVGCTGGFVPEEARKAGFEAWGIDPDASAIAYAKKHYPGVHAVHGRLESGALGDALFDMVYCSEVIEHVPDCNRFVALLARLTRPGGLLYVTTPDIGHWRRPRDVTKWDAFFPPSHCLYFNPRTLIRLLESHGFTVLHRRWAWKPGIKVIARRRSDAETAAIGGDGGAGRAAPGVIAKPGPIA